MIIFSALLTIPTFAIPSSSFVSAKSSIFNASANEYNQGGMDAELLTKNTLKAEYAQKMATLLD